MPNQRTRTRGQRQDRLRQQTALADFGLRALQADSLAPILTAACELAAAALGTDLAQVLECAAGGESLVMRAGAGWQPGVVGIATLPVAGSCEGLALHHTAPLIAPDLDREARCRPAAFWRGHAIRAMATVAIPGAKGQPPFGLLQVASRAPRAFDAGDQAFLRNCAHVVAAAVVRLRGHAAPGRPDQGLPPADRRAVVLDHLPLGVGLLDPAGRLLYANPEFRRLRPPAAAEAPAAAAEDPARLALRGEAALDVDLLEPAGAEGGRWRRVSGIPVRDAAGAPAGALLVIADIDTAKRATDRQELLTREMDHRAKNMFSVVQAVLRLTRADGMPGFVRAIEGRVMALARAQSLLAADQWTGTDLHSLLRGELQTFLDEACGGPRVTLRGPAVALPARATQPIAMAIHELATNALKYGALSSPQGRLAIVWQLAPPPGDRLQLRWTETGGPAPVGPPKRQGFGSRVLRGTLRDQLGGTVELQWCPAGLICDIALPLRA